jgi:hypothetical protein
VARSVLELQEVKSVGGIRIFVLCGIFVSLTLSSTAGAQEVDEPGLSPSQAPAPQPSQPEAVPAPEPAPETAPTPEAPQPDQTYPAQPPPLFLSSHHLHRYLLDTDPDYRSARGRKIAGIVVASAGGGLGLVIGLTSLMLYGICEGDSGYGALRSSCDPERNWAIGGFVGMGVALAVGIPLILSGSGEMKAIRLERQLQLRPHVDLSLRHGGATFSARWIF